MTNALPARKDSRVRETVLSPVAPQGFPGQTNLIDFGFDGFPDPLRAAPGLELLKSATFFIDAANAKTGDAYAFNQGTGGFALNARYGSSLAIGAADTNDPLLLPWTGENYVYAPGVAGSYIRGGASTSTINTTGDLEVVTRFALDDWAQPTTGGAAGVASKAEVVGQRSWWIRVGNNGTIFSWSADGTTTITATTVTLPVFTAGSTWWLKHTLDVDDGAGNRVHSVWYAPDQVDEPTSWTLAATNTVVGVTSIFAGTDIIAFCTSTMASQQSSGKYKRLIIRHSIGGAKVFDLNLGTEVASGAQTTVTDSVAGSALTINRSTAGRKSVAVTRPVWLLGTDDYMEVADNALVNFDGSQDFTVLVIARTWNTPASYTYYMTKQTALSPTGNKGWDIRNTVWPQVGGSIGDGSAVGNFNQFPPATTTASSSSLMTLGMKRSGTATNAFFNNTFGATNTNSYDTTNTAVLRIGSGSCDAELLAAAVFRRALSAAEIATINTYYGTA